MLEVTTFPFEAICGSSVQDAAAKSVARLLQCEEETCDIHDSDKVGKLVIGELLCMDGNSKQKIYPPQVCLFIFLSLFYYN